MYCGFAGRAPTCHHGSMKIEFSFDFSCPFAYIASTRVEALCADQGVELCRRPMLVGGVFRGTGARDSPMAQMGPARARHIHMDMHRWAHAPGLLAERR
jgi:2-hydroxychromene-2-carboxylate isomerase